MKKVSILGIPPSVLHLFETLPILTNEDETAYLRLLTGIIEDIAPKDVIDWLLVKDVADDAWETVRYRQFKAPLLELELRRAMNAAMRRILPGKNSDEIQTISEGWTSDTHLRDAAENALKQHGQTLDCVHAQAFKQCANDLERLDAMMDNAARRRDRGIRALERRRQEIIPPPVPAINAKPLKNVAARSREANHAKIARTG